MSAIAVEPVVRFRQRATAWVARLDPGLLVSLGFALLAAWPFLTRSSLVTFTDAEMHVYRAAQVEQSILAGVLYPRWAPDFFYGYGYPVFNYYSPLSYHLAAWYSILTATDVVAGLKFVLVLGFMLGSLGMYLFIRDRWGGIAGAVASSAFLLSPYVLYIDPHARGDVPEFLAISLAPAAFWATSRLRRSGSPGDVALTAVALGAIIFSHPIMGILFFGLLLLWMGWELFFGHGLVTPTGERRPRPLGMTLLAIVLGLGLSAVLWVPALLERGAIQLQNVAGPGFFDFHQHFLSPAEVFSASPVFDYGATELRFNFNLGAAGWTLALLGLMTAFHPRIRRPSVLFFALVGVILVYLMMPSSVQVWEAAPPMSYLQFPSRFLGPASVVFAVLSAAAIGWSELVKARWVRSAAGGVALALCFVTALPQLFPRPWGNFGPVTTMRMLKVELDGRAVGTTSANDFLPRTADVVPGPARSLIRSYRSGASLDKVNRATLLPGTTVTVLSHSPIGCRLEVETDHDFLLRLYTFYFPGWNAYVDGRRVPIEIAKPEGFITFYVPPGQHSVAVRFENTPARWLGWGISWASVAGVVALLVWRVRRRERIASLPGQRMRRETMLSLLAGLTVALAFRSLAESRGWFWIQSRGDRVLVAQQEYRADFNPRISLLAYDLPQTNVPAGGEVPVTLYWKAQEKISEDYQVYVHLIGPDGRLWGQSDKANPAGFPISRWPIDRYVRDEHVAQLSADAPAGVYRVVAGLWDQDTGVRLNAWKPGGAYIGDGVPLPSQITVVK